MTRPESNVAKLALLLGVDPGRATEVTMRMQSHGVVEVKATYQLIDDDLSSFVTEFKKYKLEEIK